MSLKNCDDVKESGHSNLTKVDALDATRISIYGSGGHGCFGGIGLPLKEGSMKDILPGIDLTGFDQKAPDKSTGWEHTWNKVKDFFGYHGETIVDHVKDKVVDDMKNSKNPAEQKKYQEYQEEQKKLDKYNEEKAHWGLQANINAKFPEAPNCPIHDEVDKRVQKAEQQIANDVRAHMTPAELKALDKATKEYEDGVREAHTIHNPMGTGEGFKQPPPPGEALKDYWYRIKVASETYSGR
jgi:hypothetical protein